MKFKTFETVEKEVEVAFPICRKLDKVYYYAATENHCIIVEDWEFSRKGIFVGTPSFSMIFDKKAIDITQTEFEIVLNRVRKLINEQ